MKTAPTNKKIREIISLVKEGKLIPRPEFQRRLVWTRNDKNHFIDTILRGYPFPEIYLADGDVDLDTGAGTQLLVDGLQRVSTIIQYFEGDPELRLTTALPYKTLDENTKKAFLLYDVAVRDLGAVSRNDIVEVFRRINATKYSLLDIEVSNAVYTGALKQYCERLAADAFFSEHQVFNILDLKRMGDLRYALTIVSTLISGYFNRDEAFGELLDRYNDDFPLEADIDGRLRNTFAFIDECGFSPKSRLWKKADLFTSIVEVDRILHVQRAVLQPSDVVQALQSFFDSIDTTGAQGMSGLAAIYYKAALQASNDKVNRLRRGLIIDGILTGRPAETILEKLKTELLIIDGATGQP